MLASGALHEANLAAKKAAASRDTGSKHHKVKIPSGPPQKSHGEHIWIHMRVRAGITVVNESMLRLGLHLLQRPAEARLPLTAPAGSCQQTTWQCNQCYTQNPAGRHECSRCMRAVPLGTFLAQKVQITARVLTACVCPCACGAGSRCLAAVLFRSTIQT